MSDFNNENIDQISIMHHLPPRPFSRRSEPKAVDWEPVAQENVRSRGKFGQRRTAPSADDGSANFRPLFLGRSISKTARSVLTSSSSSLAQTDRSSSTSFTPSPTESFQNTFVYNPFQLAKANLRDFIYTFIPNVDSPFLRCLLRRDRDGFQRNLSPTFFLYLEKPEDGTKIFLLAARRVTKLNGQPKYIMTTTVEHLDEKWGGIGYLGKLQRQNMSGTEYTLYDSGVNPNKKNRAKHRSICRREMAGIIYDSNAFGRKAPRKFHAIVPRTGQDIQPMKHEASILDMWHKRQYQSVYLLRNQTAEDDQKENSCKTETTTDRVAQASIKNFQLIMDDQQDQEKVVMQFNRLKDDTFSCDFGYPLCPFQAFGIALSSFENLH